MQCHRDPAPPGARPGHRRAARPGPDVRVRRSHESEALARARVTNHRVGLVTRRRRRAAGRTGTPGPRASLSRRGPWSAAMMTDTDLRRSPSSRQLPTVRQWPGSRLRQWRRHRDGDRDRRPPSRRGPRASVAAVGHGSSRVGRVIISHGDHHESLHWVPAQRRPRPCHPA